MIVATSHPLRIVLTSLVVLWPLACGNHDTGTSPSNAKTAEPASKSAAKVAPYTYPAPVSGHYAEANTGDFDLVDGFAYASASGGGTVVYVTSKPIASPILAASVCPMTEARAIGLLRDAAYLELMLDAAGKSSYFAGGTALGGRGREEDVGGGYWKIEKKNQVPGHVAASVAYQRRGGFQFDLPIVKPKTAEVSEGERVQGHRVPDGAPTPKESAVIDAYRALHKAARSKDLAALLAAQGFSAEASAAIRGLPEIDADFTLFCDRFLDPGDPGEATVYEGYGGIRAEGVNSKGEKYSNYYEFAPVESRLVLIGMSEDKR